MDREIFEPEHDDFRASVRRFIADEMSPDFEKWEADGMMPREVFAKAGAKNMLAMAAPEEYGGLGLNDFRFNQVIAEEGSYAGVTGSALGITLHNDVCLPYFLEYCNEEQRERWLPGHRRRLADHRGRDDRTRDRLRPGLDVDQGDQGRRSLRRRRLQDLHHQRHQRRPDHHRGQDGPEGEAPRHVADDHRARIPKDSSAAATWKRSACTPRTPPSCSSTRRRCPTANLLGNEGEGFKYLVFNLAQERLSIAVAAVASAQAALDWTLEYVKERTAFGKPIGSFQNSRFKLAEMKTEIDIATVYLDRCVMALNERKLSVEDGAAVKYWTTDLANKVIDECVQLHGGYGYMLEYPIARAWADNRVTRIYGGTNEIMKEIVGRSLGV